MSSRLPLPQPPVGWPLPTTNREEFARLLGLMEAEMQAAQQALAADDSDANRYRYAHALAMYDRVQALFPFAAAGWTDTQH